MTELEKKYLSLSLLCNEDNVIKVHNKAIEKSWKIQKTRSSLWVFPYSNIFNEN